MLEIKNKEYLYLDRRFLPFLVVPFLLSLLAAKKYLKKRTQNKNNFYLINDLNLIKSLINEYKNNSNSFIESELKQPYLLIDTNLRYKLSECEYDKSIVNHFLNRYVYTTRTYLIDVIIRKKFKELIIKKKKTSLHVINLQPKDIHLLVFKCISSYLIYLFGRNEAKKKLRIKQKKFKLLFKYLIKTNDRYNLDLFLSKSDMSDEYKKFFGRFLKLIKTEFQLDLDGNRDDPINFNFDHIKFLIIKKIYLDFTIVGSSLITFLNDLTNNKNNELIDEIRKSDSNLMSHGLIWKLPILDEKTKNYILSSLNLDLFLVKENFSQTVSNKIYTFSKNSYIGFNLSQLRKESKFNEDKLIRKFYCDKFDLDNPENISVIFLKSIVFNLVKNLKFFNHDDKQASDKNIHFFNFYQ
ncbi:unnamed protein product [Brachionus calyciflorus]|uniref:Uncharacterized protein n=1 Tax=Brachionus calyciflorus TaxID=104777 RepID=A0A813SXQ8_9BILA|nr:unnamed protein product [Brachionus calyciflorus]